MRQKIANVAPLSLSDSCENIDSINYFESHMLFKIIINLSALLIVLCAVFFIEQQKLPFNFLVLLFIALVIAIERAHKTK